MIIANLKIFPPAGRKREVQDILQLVRGPVLAAPGCLGCCVSEENGEELVFHYQEQWRSWPDLERHIRSSSFERILQVMELSCRQPELFFYETTETWGFDLVEKVLSTAPRRFHS